MYESWRQAAAICASRDNSVNGFCQGSRASLNMAATPILIAVTSPHKDKRTHELYTGFQLPARQLGVSRSPRPWCGRRSWLFWVGPVHQSPPHIQSASSSTGDSQYGAQTE